MKKILLIWLCCVYAVNALSQAAGEEQAILKLSRQKFNWLIHQKFDSLNLLLDEKVQYIHSNGWVQSKKDVVDDLKSGKLRYEKVDVKEASARVYDHASIVNGLGTFSGVADGKAFSLDLRYTEVYINSGDSWRLVSRHANRMP